MFDIFNKISSIINDRLRMQFNLSKDIVSLQTIEKDATEGYVSISLVSIERDTSAGISFNRKNVSDNKSAKSIPSWDMNIYVLIAAVFPKKQYGDSLKIITEILKIVQANSVLNFGEYNYKVIVEPYNISIQELSNLWSINGGTYYPSIVLKIRSIIIDSNKIIQVDTNINQTDLDI